ncbi:AAA family ATPase [Streptosporangium sp. NPDC051022]|uniref:nSTAND1 domain-containing NTPase n=1 Tax=Streptosporangium sp. NPDC051022 TaxID=3155752 RepID=UPI00343E5F04
MTAPDCGLDANGTAAAGEIVDAADTADSAHVIDVRTGPSRYAGDHLEFRGNVFHGPVIYTTHHHPAPDDPEPYWTGSPYRGLAPFGEADAAVFYGREQATEQLARTLAERLDGLGMLVVTGPSGAGKSSLLRAGLLPYLAAGLLSEAPGSECWPRLVMTPTADPLTELALQLAALTAADPAAVRRSLAEDPEGAPLLFRQALLAQPPTQTPTQTPTSLFIPFSAGGAPGPRVPQRRIVLVVDQFEEVFTLASATSPAHASPVLGEPGEAGDDPAGKRERAGYGERPAADAVQAFARALRAAAETPVGPARQPAALIVIGMRGDFWDRCASVEPLVDVLRAGPFTLAAMSQAELRRAITGPAARAGLRLQDGLADLVLGDLRILTVPRYGPGGDVTSGNGTVPGVGVLPLLSQAMLLTWQQREKGRLTIRGYGAAGGIAHAVQTGAEAVYRRLGTAQQRLARQLFHQLTVVTADGQTARRRVTYEELRTGRAAEESENLRVVLEVFTGQRLLVADADSVELAHDMLLTAWPRLAGWLQADRDDQILYGQLREDAQDWQRNDRDPSFLYRGGRLRALCRARARWQAAPLRYPPLTTTVIQFLAAADHAAAHAEQRGARRRMLARLALVALTVLTVIASLAALTAVNAIGRANERSVEALARLVALHSEGLADTDPVLSGLLAAASWRLMPSPEARYGMLATLATSVQGVLNGHTDFVSSAVFSPDGTMLASTGGDNTVRLWDAATRRQIGAPLVNHTEFVAAVAFSPDGKVLATAAGNGTARLWDVATRRQIGAPLREHAGSVMSVAFSPDGRTLATVGVDGSARLWDVATRRQIGIPFNSGASTRSRFIVAMAFGPDGRTLATAGADGAIRLWSLLTHRQIGAPLMGHTGSVASVVFSPDGRVLASAGADGTARLWDVAGRRQVGGPLMGHTGSVASVAFSPDGRVLASAGADGTARLWDVAGRRQVGDPLMGHTGSVASVAFSPDGETLATAGWDRTVRLWDVSARRPDDVFRTGHTGSVVAVAFSPDRKTLATAGWGDRNLRLWDVATRRQIGPPLTGHTGSVDAAAFSPDGRTLASGGGDGAVRLWNLATRRQIGTPLGEHTGSVTRVEFSPDGRTLVSVDNDQVVRLWNVAEHRRIGSPLSGSIPVGAFSRDGEILVIGDKDGRVRLWDVAARRPIGAPLADHTNGVSAAAFSPDGTILATGSWDDTIRLWEVAGGRLVGALPAGHSGGIAAVAFAPAGDTLTGVGRDGVAQVWDVATRRPIGAPSTHYNDIASSVSLTPDGVTVAMDAYGGGIRLWNMENVISSTDPLAEICAVAGRSLTPQEWRRYIPGQPYQQICP